LDYVQSIPTQVVKHFLDGDEPLIGQALRINYQVVSASEMESSYRDFCSVNYPGKICHMYGTLEEQVKGTVVCKTCEGSLTSEIIGACKPLSELPKGSSVNILVSGSPCDPFSLQRTKRFAEGNVKTHQQFDVTMTQVADCYLASEPEKGIFEQVWGFCLPFEKGGSETPKDRSFDYIICSR
jgi:hypothetical protein